MRAAGHPQLTRPSEPADRSAATPPARSTQTGLTSSESNRTPRHTPSARPPSLDALCETPQSPHCATSSPMRDEPPQSQQRMDARTRPARWRRRTSYDPSTSPEVKGARHRAARPAQAAASATKIRVTFTTTGSSRRAQRKSFSVGSQAGRHGPGPPTARRLALRP